MYNVWRRYAWQSLSIDAHRLHPRKWLQHPAWQSLRSVRTLLSRTWCDSWGRSCAGLADRHSKPLQISLQHPWDTQKPLLILTRELKLWLLAQSRLFTTTDPLEFLGSHPYPAVTRPPVSIAAPASSPRPARPVRVSRAPCPPLPGAARKRRGGSGRGAAAGADARAGGGAAVPGAPRERPPGTGARWAWGPRTSRGEGGGRGPGRAGPGGRRGLGLRPWLGPGQPFPAGCCRRWLRRSLSVPAGPRRRSQHIFFHFLIDGLLWVSFKPNNARRHR